MDWLTDSLVTLCYKDLTHFQLPTQVSTLGENESENVCYKLKRKKETRKVYLPRNNFWNEKYIFKWFMFQFVWYNVI